MEFNRVIGILRSPRVALQEFSLFRDAKRALDPHWHEYLRGNQFNMDIVTSVEQAIQQRTKYAIRLDLYNKSFVKTALELELERLQNQVNATTKGSIPRRRLRASSLLRNLPQAIGLYEEKLSALGHERTEEESEAIAIGRTASIEIYLEPDDIEPIKPDNLTGTTVDEHTNELEEARRSSRTYRRLALDLLLLEMAPEIDETQKKLYRARAREAIKTANGFELFIDESTARQELPGFLPYAR